MYNIDPVYRNGITGKGSTVAIAACFNIDPTDVNYFARFYRLPKPTVNIIHIDGTVDQFGNIPPPDVEPTLDVERVIATAPNATVDLYLVPDCLISQFVDIFAAIAEDPKTTAMSMSYGLPEQDFTFLGIDDLLLAQNAAIEDIAEDNVVSFAASGDNGSWGDPIIANDFLDVLYPASDPNIISVGGTTAELSANSTRLFEYAWGGSGGGYSGIFPIPSWQAQTRGIASSDFKNLPDVAFDGDPNTGAAEAFLVSALPIFPIGGTSISSPTWAGIWALVDQARRNRGQGRLSTAQATALLYSVHRSSYYDIEVGTNGYFAAHEGYDNATGLGVPNVAKLIKALEHQKR